MSPFLSALLAVVEAEREREEASEACRSPEDSRLAVDRFNDADRRLAQAGDVLEREIRQMMHGELDAIANEARREIPILLRTPLTGTLSRGEL